MSYYIKFMEDFNNKFSEDNASKNYNKYFAIAMIFVIFVLLFCIINNLKKKSANNNLSEAILLIEAENQEISRKPKDTGGLSVENLDINVYDALDKNDNNEKLKIKKKKKKMEDNIITLKNENLNDSDLLLNKIEEIEENKNIEILNNDQEINLKIKSDEKNENINKIEDLKSLGNNSLVKNIKEKKYIKPAVKVQLLAVKNKKTIENYWENLKVNYSKLFNDKSYFIEKIDLSSDNSIYRLQIGMFPDETSANNFCQEYIKIANKNKIDCIVVK